MLPMFMAVGASTGRLPGKYVMVLDVAFDTIATSAVISPLSVGVVVIVSGDVTLFLMYSVVKGAPSLQT